MAKRKPSSRVELSIVQKVAKLDAYHALTPEFMKSQRTAAEKLGISRGGLRNLLDKEAVIREEAEENGSIKRHCYEKDAEVEKALYEWWEFATVRNIPLHRRILCAKAQSFAEKAGNQDFHATDGWFSRWKVCSGDMLTMLAGEAAEAFQHFENLSSEDILNADETGIYFRALPSSTYVKKKTKNDCKGFKTAKDRITALVTSAMNGTKEDLLVIGKYKNPRCFKNDKDLPIPYDYSGNAWMTELIWERWLHHLDLKMGKENRKVLLLADNCSAHAEVYGLKNIIVNLLPANTTSVLQPCDQGIIRTLKAYFRHSFRQAIVDAIDENEQATGPEVAKKINLLQALDMLGDAWKQVKKSTIENCWRKGGFKTPDVVAAPDVGAADVVPPPPGIDEEDFLKWVHIDADVEVTDETSEEDFERNLVTEIIQKEEVKNGGEANEKVVDYEEEDEEQVLTAAQMRAALYTLQCGLQASDFTKFDDFWCLEKDIKEHLRVKFPPKQLTLDRFFKRVANHFFVMT